MLQELSMYLREKKSEIVIYAKVEGKAVIERSSKWLIIISHLRCNCLITLISSGFNRKAA